jgi:hypothetical protein
MLSAPNKIMQSTNVRLRPNLSARYPNANAPTMLPSSTAANTGPKIPGDSFHSDAILGAT